MQSYSQDLRDRVLRALARGEGPSAIARRFEVSRFYVYQVRDREQETGVRSSFQIGGHRRSRLRKRSRFARLDRSRAGADSGGVARAVGAQGIAIKIGALWHQLNKWNLTFKKNAARQRARARGRAGSAARME